MTMPEYLSTGEKVAEMPGFLRAFQLLDVLFFYKDGNLYQYNGFLGGWHLGSVTPVTSKEDAENKIKDWLDGTCVKAQNV